MTKIDFYVGSEYRSDKKELTLREFGDALVKARNTLSTEFEGFTETYGTGHYKGTEEECIIYTICLTGVNPGEVDGKVSEVAGKLAAAFQQECVLYTIQSVVGGFAKPRVN